MGHIFKQEVTYICPLMHHKKIMRHHATTEDIICQKASSSGAYIRKHRYSSKIQGLLLIAVLNTISR